MVAVTVPSMPLLSSLLARARVSVWLATPSLNVTSRIAVSASSSSGEATATFTVAPSVLLPMRFTVNVTAVALALPATMPKAGLTSVTVPLPGLPATWLVPPITVTVRGRELAVVAAGLRRSLSWAVV